MGNLPVLHVKGESIPEAWENSVVELANKGIWYPRQGPKDKGQMQVDSTMIIEVENPDSDLKVHKYVTCGINDLLEYEMEILGAKDSWVTLDPNDPRWPYHYHERLGIYPGSDGVPIDQLERVIERAIKKPFKRNLQAITWVPERDIDSKDPPCLQRLWFYLFPDGDSEFSLNMNYHFRSRNTMIAAPMNMDGIHTLQSYVRDRIAEGTGWNIKNGRMVDIIDSYHISSKDQSLLKSFQERLQKSKAKGETINDRAWNKEFVYMQMADMVDETETKIIDYTKRRLEEKGESGKIDSEVKKIKLIADRFRKEYGS